MDHLFFKIKRSARGVMAMQCLVGVSIPLNVRGKLFEDILSIVEYEAKPRYWQRDAGQRRGELVASTRS